VSRFTVGSRSVASAREKMVRRDGDDIRANYSEPATFHFELLFERRGHSAW
jgi:hypothetical protein